MDEFGCNYYRGAMFKMAQEEIGENGFEIREDFSEIKPSDRFFYPWLHEQYGVEKLRNFWDALFHQKKSIQEASQEIFKKSKSELEDEYTKIVVRTENYQDLV